MDRNLDQGRNVGKGLVYLDFSFLTNNTSNPLVSTFRGADSTWVASVTYVSPGILLVTMSLNARCRYVVDKYVDLEDLNSSDDGSYATIGAVQNEGSSTAQMTFKIYTRVVAGTKTDFTNRRVSVSMALKNSTVGI
jgi:hypothetical protein